MKLPKTSVKKKKRCPKGTRRDTSGEKHEIIR